MTLVIVFGLALLAMKGAQAGLVLLVDGIATAIAACYRWRSDRLMRQLVAARPRCSKAGYDQKVSCAQRRLLRRHLRLSIAMTAHCSLFPRSSARGYALARRLGA